MKIQKDQYDHFLQQDEQEFIETIVEYMQGRSPELVDNIPPDMLQEMVKNGIARARRYGLHTDENLISFVAVMFEIAPDFDEHPAIQAVLTDQSLAPEERFKAIFDNVPPEAWEEAEQNRDSEAWFPELRNEQG